MINAFIIVFREGFEAFLTVAIIFAYLKKTGRHSLRPAVWWGISVSVLASAVLGFVLRNVNQPLWEGVLALVAAVLVTTFVVQMWRTAPRMKKEMEQKLEKHTTRSSRVLAVLATFMFTLLMITREGMETALMLIQVRQPGFTIGAIGGALAAAGLSWLWAHYAPYINVKRFFQVTGLFLLLFAAHVVFYAIHEFSEAELLPNSEVIHNVTEPYTPLGIYGKWITLGMIVICAAWLIATSLADRFRRVSPATTSLGIALILVMATQASAESVLEGRLVDAVAQPVSGAVVTISRHGTTVASAQTDRQGQFTIKAVEPGAYLVSVKGIVRSVTIADGPPTAIELQLRLPFADQITVFGTHIAPAPERIPGSVTVLDRQTLDSAHPFSTSEALRKAAGVNVRDEEGFGLRPNIGIRGLNPTRSTKVLLLEDGLPLTYAPYGDNASYYHPPIERFESIEILKGSGQIAYGPATVGGVINYLTPIPPARPQSTLRLMGGTGQYLNAHFSFGGTWGKTGVLVDLLRKQGDGARENLSSELNDVNAKVVYDLTDAQSLTLRANWYGEDSNVTYSGLRQAEFEASPRQNPFRNDYFYGDRYGASLAHKLHFGNDVLLTTSLYGARFKRHWWRQSSNSAQRPNDSADPNCGGMGNLDTTCGNEGRLRQYDTWGVEPRVQWSPITFGLRHDIQAGVRAHVEKQERLQVNGDSPLARTGVIVENNRRDNSAYSAFLQDRLTLGRWTVTPGVRVERIWFERLNRREGARGETVLTQVVPGIGVSHTLRVATLFAGIHRGFAPPRTEDVITNAGGVVDLDPELSWNTELGMRSTLRPGLSGEVTLFRMDYESQIVPASVAGGIGATLTNAGETKHQGMELSARVDTLPLLGTSHNMFATVAYTNLWRAEFAGDRLSSIPGSTNVRVSGNRIPYAPEHLLTAGVGYLMPSGLEFFVEAVRVSEQFGDDLNTIAPTVDGQRGLLPGYTTWNATVNMDVAPLRSTFFITVKNVFDELHIADRTRGIIPGTPRMVQAGFTFRH